MNFEHFIMYPAACTMSVEMQEVVEMMEGAGVCEEGGREGADGSSGVWNGSVGAGRVREEAGALVFQAGTAENMTVSLS